MTEEEWKKATRPEQLLVFLEKTKQCDNRKARLLGVAFCRRIWDVLTDIRFQRFVELGELRADGLVPWVKIEGTVIPADPNGRTRTSHTHPAEVAALATTCRKVRPGYIAWLTRHAVVRDLEEPGCTTGHDREAIPELSFFHDIFGNPFRPVAFDPNWRTSDAVSIARAMYESRDFSPMPILADALQNAGCEHADILDHCRGTGPHVRGCWVVDLVFGKA